MNDIDFKRMIRDFDTSARHEEQLKKIKKKRAAESKKYQETIKHMKELKEETYQKKNEELKQKLKRKDMILITSLENKEKDKMEEKRRIITEMIEKENKAKKNIEKFMVEQEKIRLQFEKDINDKSKSIFINIINIIYLVQNFKNKNEEFKEKTKKTYAKKNLETEIRHENNMKNLNILREKLAKETEEKEFKKYISFYFLRRAQENELKQKKKEKRTKMKEKNERMEELERMNKEREKDLLNKINKREVIKEKYDKQRKERFLMDKNKREEKMKKCHTQKIEIMKEQNERRMEILDYQFDLLKRSKKRDKTNEMKRINAGEKRVMEQMTMERNLSDFYKRMNYLKDQSIYKKTMEERYKIYKDLKREEAERKKKELEDKLEKQRI